MKAKTVRIWTYTLYDTVILTGEAAVVPNDRLILMAPQKLTVNTTLDYFKPGQLESEGAVGRILAAANAPNVFELLGPNIVSSAGEPGKTAVFGERVTVMSRSTKVVEREQEIPEFVARGYFGPDVPLTTVGEMSLVEVVETLKRLSDIQAKDDIAAGHKPRQNDLGELMEIAKTLDRGMNSATGPLAAAINEVVNPPSPQIKVTKPPSGKVLSEMGAKGLDSMFGDMPAEEEYAGNSEHSRFAPAMVTDFTNVIVPKPNGKAVGVQNLRVAHLSQPIFHKVGRGEVSDPDVIGYWKFDKAAIGEAIPGTQTVAFAAINGLVVMVKSNDAIDPAGQLAIPDRVWNALRTTEAEPQWMSADAVKDFNTAHGSLHPDYSKVAKGKSAN